MQALTTKGSAAKERMLDATIGLMRSSGLSGAGINEIVKASGAPKGSVYHFFPLGKQQIAIEAMEVHSARMQALIEQAMASKAAPGDKVRALFRMFAQRLEEGRFRSSCAAGTVCLDLDEQMEPVREVIHSAFSQWIELIANRLGLADKRRARSLAGVLLSAIEGAYILGRAEKSSRPFTEAGRWLAALVEQETPAARLARRPAAVGE